MDVKRIVFVLLIAAVIAASAGAVSAGLFDGLFGGQEPDHVVEIGGISFNTTDNLNFELVNGSHDEDGYWEWYSDVNQTESSVHIYNYSYVDENTWNWMVQHYTENQIANLPSQTVDGIVVYNTTVNGQPGYVSSVQDDDLKIIVDFASPDLGETVKMASTLKFS